MSVLSERHSETKRQTEVPNYRLQILSLVKVLARMHTIVQYIEYSTNTCAEAGHERDKRQLWRGRRIETVDHELCCNAGWDEKHEIKCSEGIHAEKRSYTHPEITP